MLCYRCGSHVPDTEDSCANCGQRLTTGSVRHTTGTFSRRKLNGQTLDGAPFKTGDVLAGRYTIRDVVGAGPLGYVFRAHDGGTETDLAIKTIHPRLIQTDEERRNFKKVMKVAQRLSHQNLVRVHDEGEEQEHPFFTMQFLEGLTLRRIIDLRISKGNFFAASEIEPILAQMCDALESAHKLGPHTNLKPDNVIVLPDLLKVTDYGLGSAVPRLPFGQAQKQRRTDRHVAPEYTQGGEIDHRVDIYALGVLVGEMLSGQTPEDSVPELSSFNSAVSAGLEGFYRRAVNENPLARPKTARAFFEEFKEHSSKPPALRRGTTEAPLPAAPNRRLSSVAALALVPRPTQDTRLPSATALADNDAELTPTPSFDNGTPTPSIRGRLDSPREAPPPPPPFDDDDLTARVPSVPQPVLSGWDRAPLVMTGPNGQVPRYLIVSLVVAGLLIGAAGSLFVWANGFSFGGSGASSNAAAPSQDLRSRPAQASDETTPEGSTPRPSTASNSPDARRAAALWDAEQLRRAEEKKSRAQERKGREGSAAGEDRSKAGVPPVTPTEEGGCPEGMRYVSAGAFKMGTSRDDPMMAFDEKAPVNVNVAAFCVDQYEYPNKKGAAPLTNVAYADAKRFCEAKSRRLCSEEEWEKACKGPRGTRFPYGNTFDPGACNTEDSGGGDRTVALAGRFSKCRSGYGVMDMSGNVAEWTSSPYVGNSDRTQKGGSATRPDYASRCSARKNGAPSSKSFEVGFRCCMDAGDL